MEDKDIEYSLKCCINRECDKCKYEKWKGSGKCISYLQCDACSLIMRLRAENSQ